MELIREKNELQTEVKKDDAELIQLNIDVKKLEVNFEYFIKNLRQEEYNKKVNNQGSTSRQDSIKLQK